MNATPMNATPMNATPMNATPMSAPPMSARTSKELRSQLFVIRLRRHLNMAQRRRFWRGMRSALRRHSLVFAQVGGLTAVMSVGHPLGEIDRRWVVDWLIDQAPVREVVLLPRRTLVQFCSADPEEGFDAREAGPEDSECIRRAVRELLGWVMCHYLVALGQAGASLEASHG